MTPKLSAKRNAAKTKARKKKPGFFCKLPRQTIIKIRREAKSAGVSQGYYVAKAVEAMP